MQLEMLCSAAIRGGGLGTYTGMAQDLLTFVANF